MTDRDPERLRVMGATDLEQRLLTAAAAETPSPEQSRRMATALGIAVGAGLTAASSSTAAATATAGSSLVWPLVSVGVAALAVAGAAVGWSHTHRTPAPAPAAHVAAPAAPAVVAPAAPALEPPAPASHPRRHRAAPGPAAPDLRAEIALLDAARAAVADGDDTRALALLHRYDATCPNGAFRPESAALQVETLAHLGQTDRARALGRDFIAAHPDSPLVARVQRAIR